MPAYVGLIFALAVAIVVSVIDLSTRRSKGLYRRALPLCGLFVSFDATASLILFIVLRAGAELIKHGPTALAGVVAGLVAPLLMRTKISIPFTKGQQVVNAVAMLRRLQLWVSGEIDDVCAAGETAWILYKVLPTLRAIPLSEVEAWVIQSVKVKYTGPAALPTRRKCIEDARRAVKDALNEEDRKHLLIQILLDKCGRRQVTALMRRAKLRSKELESGHAAKTSGADRIKQLESGTADRGSQQEVGSPADGDATADPDIKS